MIIFNNASDQIKARSADVSLKTIIDRTENRETVFLKWPDFTLESLATWKCISERPKSSAAFDVENHRLGTDDG